MTSEPTSAAHPAVADSNWDPTAEISLNLAQYIRERKEQVQRTTIAGQPDYAFSADIRLRAKLASIGPLRAMAEIITATAASVRRQMALMQMLQVSADQFPSVHKLSRHCANTLGVPIASLFIESSPQVNAYTIATDDRAPIIVVSSAAVDALSEDELCFVIGHEYGHIHNLHGVYNTMGSLAKRGVLQGSIMALSLSTFVVPIVLTLNQVATLGLSAWSRAGEITCDRAGLLCAKDPQSGESGLAKLSAPIMSGKLGEINPDAVANQAEKARRTLMRWQEATHSHPIIGKRIQAVQWFTKSALFAQRRPDLGLPEKGYAMGVVDAEVEKIISLL